METAIQSLIREKIKKDEIDRVFEIDYEKAINQIILKISLKIFILILILKQKKIFLTILKKIMLLK